MMNEIEVAEWARSLSENERLILATYQGSNCMPDSIERFWNADALENLVMQGIIDWTIAGYELTEVGVPLVEYILKKDKTAGEGAGGAGDDPIEHASRKRPGKRVRFGEPCPKCGTEVVKIARDTLDEMKTLTKKFNTVSKAYLYGKQAFIPVCPECDSYALGIEFKAGFPFILKNGQESDISQIEHLLWQPEKRFRSEDLENIVENSEPDGTDSAKIIPFPHYSVPQIDWDEIEAIRNERYPNLPPEIMEVLKPSMESTPDSADSVNFQITGDTDDMYPPNPIPLYPGKACAIWMMDLLDRFGGTVSYNDLSCTIEREESKYPVFVIQRISLEQFWGIDDCLQEYEHLMQNKYWRIFSKDISEFNLVMLFAKDLTDETRIFQGLFDAYTFAILKEGLSEGKQPWDEILQLAGC